MPTANPVFQRLILFSFLQISFEPNLRSLFSKIQRIPENSIRNRMIVPTQKHGDTTSQDVKPCFLLLCHQQTTIPETRLPRFLRPETRIGFGA
ncbi:hypothetical protein E1A91_D05G023600v1 [Gossypium mustelinum]|uniref:Uncharacterized protein n=2 Tax=Gossypium TaxID=3633 RepID=A0A0D2THU4_GOSRA|nr:hypothetical protein B456_009G022900 [Gossypium raimondii]TYI79454.1 hypothetical protein E1A91_D05G023600v1 [Gossypium mustelinum]